MENWEYKQVYRVYSDVQEALNILNVHGGQGWELCASNESMFYFKRPMKCENCKYYKPSEYCAFDSKCEKIGLLHNHNGCEKFKPKN